MLTPSDTPASGMPPTIGTSEGIWSLALRKPSKSIRFLIRFWPTNREALPTITSQPSTSTVAEALTNHGVIHWAAILASVSIFSLSDSGDGL
ncbi:hypothetical protein D3C81_1860440 [compost metagenome]